MTAPSSFPLGPAAGVIAVGRLPMHALTRAPHTMLDGEWDFQLLPEFDAPLRDQWTRVTVPELWTMREPADQPHYTNITMPFSEVPPGVPANNPTGVYRRSFLLPAGVEATVILRVGAAEGYLRVLVNGVLIGESSDSHLAAEFDVTAACVPGSNDIELRVAKWSAFSYLEDQDQWWQAGISRSVELLFLPPVRIADVGVVADFDPENGTGSLKLTVATTGLSGMTASGHSARIRSMCDELSQAIGSRSEPPSFPTVIKDRSTPPPDFGIPDGFNDVVGLQASGAYLNPELSAMADYLATVLQPADPPGMATLSLDNLIVTPWSAEVPHLETVVVELVADGGQIVDSVSVRVGFRRVELAGRELLINGRAVLLQGVNRHDFDPQTGRVMSRRALLEDLVTLKRFNFNAIRTSHYPNDPEFLNLCDEIGFYVIDEADIEGHAHMTTLPSDPRYSEAFLSRVARMIQRDRNHPSVIAWSLGNESGYGPNHDAAAAWARSYDPTRPVQYEGAIAADWYGGRGATDIICPMYPSFESLAAFARDPRADRPLIMCEYAYSQGNSTGGLADYWNLIEDTLGLQGGFIWQFKDHALDPDGSGKYKYGGDFGDEPNDGAVVLNGIVFANGEPKPAMFEARGIFSPVRIQSSAEDLRAGLLRVHSRRYFSDFSDLEFDISVADRHGIIANTPVGVECGPGATAEIALAPDVLAALGQDAAVAFTLTARTAGDAVWAPAGTIIAEHQITLPRAREWIMATPTDHDLKIDEKGDISHPLLASPPHLCLWRAMTDNDTSYSMNGRFLRSGFFELEPTSVAVKSLNRSSSQVRIDYRAAHGECVVHMRSINMTGSGEYEFVEHVTLPEGFEDVLRVGIAFELVPGFDCAEWLGLGPWENYNDRQASALLGRWRQTIPDLAVPYVQPQENGGRGAVEELILDGAAGTAATTHSVPLQMTVSRYSIAQLEEANHWWALPHSEATFVNLDIAHRGVGTAMLGPDTRHEYRASALEYTWRWQLKLQESGA